jgi:hypothetical protein
MVFLIHNIFDLFFYEWSGCGNGMRYLQFAALAEAEMGMMDNSNNNNSEMM